MNTNELKEKLTAVRNNDYAIDGSPALQEAVTAMLQHIGTTDPVLRDELIYKTFLKWTLNGTIQPELMKQILWTSLDEGHLFYQIGEKDTDSVFTRSFSVLIVPLAMHLNSEKAYLTREDVIRIKDTVIEYMQQEKDVRGYVEGKGWAHSAAHGADALEDLARCEHIGRTELIELLDTVKAKVCIREYTYIHEEDERMAFTALSIFNRNLLKDDDIMNWLLGFGDIQRPGMDPGDYPLYINIKNFLRSLYFKLLPQMEHKTISDAILGTLGKLEGH